MSRVVITSLLNFLTMNILALDQSRSGGYAIFDYETKQLITYGSFSFPNEKYSYPKAIFKIKRLVDKLIKQYDVHACFIEEIALKMNVVAFKRLAQLQGVLENYFIEHYMLYDIIQPTVWQNYAGARKRTSKEIQNKTVELNTKGKKETKILSIQFIHDVYGIDTSNDGIADAIGIGHYAVNNIKIEVNKE